MRAVAHLIGLVNPAGELVVKLAGRTDAELVNVQSSGIRAGPGDAGIVHAPLQVQVSAQRAVTRPGSGESAAGTLQGNRALRHRIGERAARAGQLDEPVIQRDDFRRPAGQVPLNGPLGVGHSARLPRAIIARPPVIGRRWAAVHPGHNAPNPLLSVVRHRHRAPRTDRRKAASATSVWCRRCRRWPGACRPG